VQRHRIEALRAPPIGFAHRGARADAQENTLEAFEVALASGATGLESDVWLTADGEVVLDHDGVVRKGWRKHPISSYARSDLPTHIPTLEELYADCGVDYELSLDMKDRGALDATIAVARSAGAEGRLWICDPDPEVLADWRHRVRAARLVNSTRLERIQEGPERRAATLAETGIDALNLRHDDWTGGLTTLLHRFDRYCFGWAAQHERVVLDLVMKGVDGIYSDHVGRMMSVIDRTTA
jgi:glycerophosphoryl diester phosphodiesterase